MGSILMDKIIKATIRCSGLTLFSVNLLFLILKKTLSQLIYAQVSIVSTTYILYKFFYVDEKDPL